MQPTLPFDFVVNYDLDIFLTDFMRKLKTLENWKTPTFKLSEKRRKTTQNM